MTIHLLPNLITLGRFFMVPLTVYFVLVGELEYAFWLFVAAGVSDALDGAIARMFNAQTVLGGFLDPLADKALLVSVYISLANVGMMPLWLVILVVSRDLSIVGGVLLSYTLHHPVSMKPLYISKVNTLAQLILAALVLAIQGPGLHDPIVYGVSLSYGLERLVALTTVFSGLAYLASFDLLFSGPEKPSGDPP